MGLETESNLNDSIRTSETQSDCSKNYNSKPFTTDGEVTVLPFKDTF